MDQRRKEIVAAERRAESILAVSKNHFLGDISSFSIKGENCYIPNITKWIKLNGYRAARDESCTREMVTKAIENWISSKRNFEDEIGYTVLINDDNTGVYLGSRRISPQDVFRATVTECNIQEISPPQFFTQYNGIMVGSLEGDSLAELMLNSNLLHCYISLFIVPYTSIEVENRIRELEKYYNELEPYKSFQRTYGVSTRRTEEIVNNNISSALKIIREDIEFLKKYRGIGLVRTILKYGASTFNEYEQLTSIIYAVMRKSEDSYNEPIRSFKIDSIEYDWNEHLSVPYALLKKTREGVHLLSVQSIDKIVNLCMLPKDSTRSFFVKNYKMDENSRNIYGIETMTDGEVNIGNSMVSNREVRIPLKKLTSHMCVFGSTGAGKTTTMKKVLMELHRNHIPFVVVEAAKKEYVDLICEVDNLSVYSTGINGLLLSINPLEPEDGILIENQVDMIVRAIVSAHGNEHPIPESFEGLLKYTYEKYGWMYGEIAYKDKRKPFPTFYDVYSNINEYIEEHALYGLEVKQNLKAALTLRSENLYSGALGKCFEKQCGLTAKDIIEKNTIIELADFSESATIFIMNILLFKLQSYLRQLQNSDELKRAIVVEEAHNVFRKTELEGSGRDINNQYFDKMFSEIRASGTGIIVCDQRPSVLSDAVIANTAIKIIHAMDDKKDRDIISSSLDLTEIQNKKIREFDAGECLVSMRGIFGQDMVKVEKKINRREINSACIICNSRYNCKKRSIREFVGSYPNVKKTYFVKKIMSNPYNSRFINLTIDRMMEDMSIVGNIGNKVCALGMIIAQDTSVPFEVARFIVSTYKKHLTEGGV